MPWTEDFEVDHYRHVVRLRPDTTWMGLNQACTAALSNLIQKALDKKTFSFLHDHSEPYGIVGSKYPVAIERYARSLFGTIGRGAHLTVYTHSPNGLKIWVLEDPINCFHTLIAWTRRSRAASLQMKNHSNA